MVARTPTTAPIIGNSDTALTEPLDWQQIANEMAAEVIRLRAEVDRLSELQRGGGKSPLESKADWTHPLYETWVEMGLDEVGTLADAWAEVGRGSCPKCDLPLLSGPYEPFQQCLDCQLCYIASDGHFALDTIERAQERGPDA